MSSNIKQYDLFIEESEGKKPKRILRKKLSSGDFGKEFTHKLYLDFVSDGVPKEAYGEVKVKVGDVIPVNKPPVVSTTSIITVKPSEPVKILATISDPENQPLTVKWESTGSTVDFKEGNEGNSYWIEFTAPAEDAEFSFRVTATDDKGAVAYGNVTVKVRKEPEPEPKPQIKLGQIGDTHGEQEGVVLLKTREKCDIVIHTGDVTDTESDDDGYINAVNQAGYKYGEDVLNAQGNHESQEEGGEGAQEDMENAFPSLKQSNWLQFLVKGNVAVIINNTQISGYSQLDSIASKHVMDSLEKVKQLRAEGKIDWVVFAQHKPLYTLQGGHDPEYNFRYNHHSKMDEAGVDFFFDGHVHNVQRTVPIMFGGDGTNVPPIINSKMKGDAHDTSQIPHGIICVVNGSSTKSHSLSENSNAWTPFATDDTNSYCVLEFNGKNCTGKIIDIDSGSVQHTFKVTKETGEPEPEKPVIVVNAPTRVQPSATGTIDASRSIADSIVMMSREGLPLTSVGQWINTFIAPNVDNTDLEFTLNATRGVETLQKYVTVHVQKDVPDGEEIDTYGLKWLVAKGQQSIIEMSRDEADDDRWSGNVTGLALGYEATFIGKSIGTSSGSHFAMKCFGGNHSKGDWQNQRWYDLGIRSDGTIQLQWEGPHPSNHDFTLPDIKQFIKKLSKGLEGNWIGLKWCILKANGQANGSPSNGGVRVRMWVDEDPIDVATGKPKNNWKLAFDFIDGVDVNVIDPQTFSAPDEQDCEVRRSNTEQHDVFGDGKIYEKAQDGTPALHVRALASQAEARTIEGKILKVALSEGHRQQKKTSKKEEYSKSKKYKKHSA